MQMDLGETPGVLEFTGPDAVRFLNGQVTQDVRLVMGGTKVLPSCVTDAKGKLQFRIWLAGAGPEAVVVFCQEGAAEDLEARLTRYLIADDVEVKDRTREISTRDFDFPDTLDEEARIKAGFPKWGAELKEGMLPPEAGLDTTDISYNKGCYIGQEVISRIKSAGKVNRTLTKLNFEAEVTPGEILNGEGKVCGEVTSVSGNIGLGYLKRNVDGSGELLRDGVVVTIRG
ncbi:YgfZ/GcvT domain-containing protein [Luteolibacter sp. AS25]|uniref:CAF17-like 4Fe-4S cluster assembly/insertion protein YgfZ n=1 Tax=Luteolibacter sp. AS25 TaxID=3135776 RepID=UPI00398AC058